MNLLKTYTISTAITLGELNVNRITEQIEASGFVTGFSGIVYKKGTDQFTVHGESLTNEEGLDALVLSHEATTLNEYKQAKSEKIDQRTGELISQGYTFDGVQFSLSQNAQINIMALNVTRDEIPYPVRYNNIDDTIEYDVVDATAIHNMYLTALSTKKSHLDSGTLLKDSVRAAVDRAAVDAVEDNR